MIYEKHGTGLMVEGRFIYVGMPVRVNENSCYVGLYGRIVEIRTGEDLAEEGSTPAVYCRFGMPVLQEEVRKLEESISAANQQQMMLKDISLDGVRMEPGDLDMSFEQTKVTPTYEVWAVVEDWSVDDEAGHNETLYENRDDALTVFHKQLSVEAEEGCISWWADDEEFQVEEDDAYYECWLDGEYVSNHYLVKLEQMEVVKAAAQRGSA